MANYSHISCIPSNNITVFSFELHSPITNASDYELAVSYFNARLNKQTRACLISIKCDQLKPIPVGGKYEKWLKLIVSPKNSNFLTYESEHLDFISLGSYPELNLLSIKIEVIGGGDSIFQTGENIDMIIISRKKRV